MSKRDSAVGHVALLFATSGHSGVDRIVSNLLPEFGRTEMMFDLLAIRGHGPYLEELPSNVRPITLSAAHRNTVLPPLVRYLRRERPTAVVTASHRLNRALLLARRIARVNCRVAIRMGMSVSAQLEELGSRRGERLRRSMHYWYPRADAVIAPSAGVGDDLVRLAGVTAGQLHVIPNPIVTEKLKTLKAEPLEHDWFGGGAPPVILSAGSLEPRKDFATLIRAFARVRARRPCRVVVLGEGRQRNELAGLARE
ncbi:MAG: glycosyltransferase, partial [Halofilum sp. (in: g-proteobacteria)]